MTFSQRKGHKRVPDTIQRDSISNTLRVSLWSLLTMHVWNRDDFKFAGSSVAGMKIGDRMDQYADQLWFHVYKQPVDARPTFSAAIVDAIRVNYFNSKWYEVFDFLEFTLIYLDDARLSNAINNTLENELSAYRFVSSKFTDITDQQELDMLSNALANDEYPGVREHLQRALELLSDRSNPDYRNSIKESISAVESMARTIAGNPKATLGDALKELEKGQKLHTALSWTLSIRQR